MITNESVLTYHTGLSFVPSLYSSPAQNFFFFLIVFYKYDQKHFFANIRIFFAEKDSALWEISEEGYPSKLQDLADVFSLVGHRGGEGG